MGISTDLTLEQLYREFRHLSKTAKKYVEDHERNKDGSSLKQAAFALGKASSLRRVLSLSNGYIPNDILADEEELTEAWWNLKLE